MIKSEKPLSLAEAAEVIKENQELKAYIKKFKNLDTAKAKKLREEIIALDLLKVKQKDIAKIIDILPEDASDLNKIFTDVSLDENETNKILEVVKKYK